MPLVSDSISQDELNLLLSGREVDLSDGTFDVWADRDARGVLVIHIVGYSLGAAGQEVFGRVESLVRQVGADVGGVVFDLTKCTYLSSVAIGLLGHLLTGQIPGDMPVVLAAANRRIRDAIGILGLEQYFVVCDSVDDALRAAAS